MENEKTTTLYIFKARIHGASKDYNLFIVASIIEAAFATAEGYLRDGEYIISIKDTNKEVLVSL